MTVDLSKARAGEKVRFRCGGEAKILFVIEPNFFRLSMVGGFTAVRYGENGSSCDSSLLDIIEIIPASFDWKTVKPGMAFKYDHGMVTPGKLVHFVGWHLECNKTAVVAEDHGGAPYDGVPISHLVRDPEHDITPDSSQ